MESGFTATTPDPIVIHASDHRLKIDQILSSNIMSIGSNAIYPLYIKSQTRVQTIMDIASIQVPPSRELESSLITHLIKHAGQFGLG